MSVLNSIYFASLMTFFLVALTGPLYKYHGEFFEVPVIVLHLVLLLYDILTYSGFSLLPLQHQHGADVFLFYLE